MKQLFSQIRTYPLLSNNLAVYALYDQSFIPQSGVDAIGQRFDPQRGNSLEAGAKKNGFNINS
ncbi:hypothetical protein [Chitinophaga pinensis]|uniref:Uncharacterized protein n=1 Tax=Chitinophaga pinensis TaxID=79329 RepID=A0A5C6LI86_9BACT|nr:hypothetical protein [Chitinophaga pinensis]TWV91264.1 hypothetical protein FEF09_28880 [Chitinophaga pinensis]